MSAFAFETPNKVWQRVKIALGNSTNGGVNEVIQRELDALKLYLATQAGNPDLQFLPYVSTSVDDAGGQLLATGAARILAIYGKKLATETDVYLVSFDDATDDAGAGTDGRTVQPFLEASEESLFISPKGVILAAGLVMKAYTDFDGTSDSSAADCPNGFVIVKGA
jgi:hypothetical protein